MGNSRVTHRPGRQCESVVGLCPQDYLARRQDFPTFPGLSTSASKRSRPASFQARQLQVGPATPALVRDWLLSVEFTPTASTTVSPSFADSRRSPQPGIKFHRHQAPRPLDARLPMAHLAEVAVIRSF